jgi:hypothetical protein
MWTTLVFAATLGVAPAQAGDLSLSKGTLTHWLLGAPRASNKYLPGDIVWLTFDMKNARVDDQGRVLYSMAMEVSDTKGKVWYKNEPGKLEAFNALGGGTLPCYAHVNLGLDQPPGTYTVKVTVTDLGAKAKASDSVSTKFEVARPEFGIVQVSVTNDDRGLSFSPALGVPGEAVWVNFWVTGFARPKQGKTPQLRLQMRILDEDGQPTLAKPFSGEVGKEVGEADKLFPAQFQLRLNRTGKFTVELQAEDVVAKKTAKVSFPLTVIDPPK